MLLNLLMKKHIAPMVASDERVLEQSRKAVGVVAKYGELVPEPNVQAASRLAQAVEPGLDAAPTAAPGN